MTFAHNLTTVYFAKKNGDWLTNSNWLHNLYRILSDELSMNKILDQMNQQLWILKIFSYFSRFLHRIWLFSPNNQSVYLFSLIVKVICFVTLWSTTVRTFVSKHQRIYTLIIFSNFSLFFYRIWPFCPNISKSWTIQLCSTANIFC